MHVHIPFEEALKASCIFDDTATDSTAGPWVKPGTDSYYTKKELIDGAANGTWMAVSLVIARPFIEHRMMSAVLAVAGSDTGATLFGPADMQISANTSVKTIEGHYTCHTKSVITKPQNVMVLRDVMCNGYVAGCNTAFFGAKDPKAADKEYSKEQIQADINTRLTMADGDEVDYPSMLAFYEDFNEAAKRDQVISISNRVLPWDTTNGDTRDQFPGGKTGWDLSAGKGLEGIHYGEDLRATSNQDFIAASTVNNSVCFIGPHRVYSPWSATYQELVPGQGHFGPDALPGVRTQLSCKFCNSHSLLTLHLALTGCPLAPWRVGVARVGAQRDDGRGGGDALAARLPAPRRVGVGRRRRPVKKKKRAQVWRVECLNNAYAFT